MKCYTVNHHHVPASSVRGVLRAVSCWLLAYCTIAIEVDIGEAESCIGAGRRSGTESIGRME